MAKEMTIEGIETIEELAQITAELVKQGLTFVAKKYNDEWTITLTGGY